MSAMTTFNNSNDLPPVQNLSMIIRSSTVETDPAKDAQDDYDSKVSQLSPLNSKTKPGWYIYFKAYHKIYQGDHRRGLSL